MTPPPPPKSLPREFNLASPNSHIRPPPARSLPPPNFHKPTNTMSALRTAAAKHTRSLSQPLRRTFYTPFAALQHSQLPTQSTSAAAGGEAPATAAHEHESEHAARTVYVVAEPNAADFKSYGVPAGAYPVATPYNQHHHYPMGAYSTAENVNINVRLLPAVL